MASQDVSTGAALLDDLVALARAYEQWEADLILCHEAWHGRDLPVITEALWDRLLEIQAQRNAALRRVTTGR